MDFATLQPFGIYASLLAVVVSVIGLTLQMRLHTKSLRSNTYARSLDRLAAVQGRLSVDAPLTDLFLRAVQDPQTLSRQDRSRFAWVLYEIFGVLEFIHDEARSGALPKGVWERWDATLAWWLSLPGVVAWWQHKPTAFNPQFTRHVEQRIAEPAHDKDSARAWHQFLEGLATESTASAYVIANVDVQDPVRYADYVKLTPATVAPFGGRFIVRGGRAEKLEGDTPANRIVVLKFDDYEKARAWYDSANYREAKAVRQSASTASLILVEGVQS